MSNNPLVSVIIVVRNGEKYIRHCLDAVKNQSYDNLQVIIFDNDSDDQTKYIALKDYPQFRLVQHHINLGPWPGFEYALRYADGKYFIALCVDVVIDKDFITNAIKVAEKDERIGAIQGKIYQYDISSLTTNDYKLSTDIIDTCGFEIHRSRKIGNIGHGLKDDGQFNQETDIFAVEGAVPFIRRDAFEDLRIGNHIIDHAYFWYGDDLDWAWRMHMFGWRQVYCPDAVAWHDRTTTKGMSRKFIIGQIARLRQRLAIPIMKRRLDWANTRFTIIKNDYIINILKDFPRIIAREFFVFGYTLLFEPKVFLELGRFFRLLPGMIRSRREILARAKVGPQILDIGLNDKY